MRQRLEALSDPVLAFSGGVDSSFLLAALVDVRGRDGVLPVLGVSPSLSAHQREQARRVAAFLEVRLSEVETSEMGVAAYRANLGDRCFWCKDTLYTALRQLHPAATLLDGTNLDDLGGHRPGLAAARSHGVLSPLAECGLTKAAIREASRRRGLPTADLPASPCLASRFPAGVPVTEDGLHRIEAAEAILREFGFAEARVRNHGDHARIEVPAPEVPRLASPAVAATLAPRLKSLGFRFVSLDLEGFRPGSGSTLPV